MISPEYQLILLLLGLYFYECCFFVYTNQALVAKTYRGEWTVSLGSDRWIYRGKELCFLNPLTPIRPVHALSWSLKRLSNLNSANAIDNDKQYTHYKLLALCLAITLFLVFPAVLIAAPTDKNVLGVLLLNYLIVLYINLSVFVERSFFHLSLRESLSITAEYLFCPPLAVNVVRRLSLGKKNRLDFVEWLVKTPMTAQQHESIRRAMLQRIDDAIELSPDNDERLEMMQRKDQIAHLS